MHGQVNEWKKSLLAFPHTNIRLNHLYNDLTDTADRLYLRTRR